MTVSSIITDMPLLSVWTRGHVDRRLHCLKTKTFNTESWEQEWNHVYSTLMSLSSVWTRVVLNIVTDVLITWHAM